MEIISVDALSKEANGFLRKKDYKQAFESYREYLNNTAKNEPNRYRNVNSILVSIYNLLLKETSNELLNEYESYLKEYIHLAESSDTVEWANNIIEDLLEYSLEICLMKHTENQNKYEQQKEEVNTWIDKFIKPFITSLILPEKREEKIFYDVIIQKIFKERTNFERKGHYNQNIVNTFMLGDFYLLLTEKSEDYNNTRSNVFNLFSELIYYCPDDYKIYLGSNENDNITALNYVNKSIMEYSRNLFAKNRKNQLSDLIVVQKQLHMMSHDINAKISSLKSLTEKVNKNPEDKDSISKILKVVKDFEGIIKISREKVPVPEPVNIFELLQDLCSVDDNYQNISIITDNQNCIWKSNYVYLKIILENLIKNSFEAYDRNKLSLPDPPLVIEINNHLKEIRVIDQAGGIPDDLIRNNKLFEPYTSEKSIEINTGMGLALVKKASELIELDLKFEVKDKSTTFIIKEIKE